MLHDDKTRLPVEHDLTEADDANPSSKAPADSAVLATRKRLQPDAEGSTKPHRNTGSLDSLGGGRLP